MPKPKQQHELKSLDVADACNNFLGALCNDLSVKHAARTLLIEVGLDENRIWEVEQTAVRNATKALLERHEDLRLTLWLIMLAQTTRDFYDRQAGPKPLKRAIEHRLELEERRERKKVRRA
jgi:hypothetical protein